MGEADARTLRPESREAGARRRMRAMTQVLRLTALVGRTDARVDVYGVDRDGTPLARMVVDAAVARGPWQGTMVIETALVEGDPATQASVPVTCTLTGTLVARPRGRRRQEEDQP
jgi:hypothetical protein